MVKVLGMGGIFLRAKNPEALRDWYTSVLGLDPTEGTWLTAPAPAPIVFEPYTAEQPYFDGDKPVMLNFRVADLAATIAELKSAGIPVRTDPSWNTPNIGQVARIYDPEGNPVELWQPADQMDS